MLDRGKTRLYKRLNRGTEVEDDECFEKLTFNKVIGVIPAEGALVFAIVTTVGSAFVILPAGVKSLCQKHVVDLQVSRADLVSLLAGGNGHKGLVNAQFDWKRGSSHREWLGVISDVGRQLWTQVMEPLNVRLGELGIAASSQIVMFPHDVLGILPLHVAWRIKDENVRYFFDDHVISVAPSVEVRVNLLKSSTKADGELTVLADPTGDLPFAEFEASIIARSHGRANVMIGKEVTVAEFARQLENSSYLHLACHGYFDWRDPQESGLILANDETVTLRIINSLQLDLKSVRLVTLSGCDTGVFELFRRVNRNVFGSAPAEYTGLAMALLASGVGSVLCTQWPVDVYPTALIMGEFYRQHFVEQKELPFALKASQNWLRALERDALLGQVTEALSQSNNKVEAVRNASLRLFEDELMQICDMLRNDYGAGDRPFDHPYYWGAFTLLG
jgi:CHAT domain-containing protein